MIRLRFAGLLGLVFVGLWRGRKRRNRQRHHRLYPADWPKRYLEWRDGCH